MVFLLNACATLGLAPAKTFQEKWTYAVNTNIGVRASATNAVVAGEISSADAEQVLTLTDQVRGVLDSARLVFDAGDVEGANKKLALASAVLVQVQAYLRARGVK